MDRKSLYNRSRRTTIMPVRMSVASSKKLPLPARSNFQQPNKENDCRGVRRNLMGSTYSTKVGKPSKGYCSSTIQRRLSFTKNDTEVPARSSPNASRNQGNISTSSDASSENNRFQDESMLYPMSANMSIRSPFSANFVTRTVQKAVYPSVSSPIKLSKNAFFKSASSTPKVALSDKTKDLLKKMGIDPDCPDLGKRALNKSAEKTRVLERSRETYLPESAQETKSSPRVVERAEEPSHIRKDTGTSPHVVYPRMEVVPSVNSDGILNVAAKIRDIRSRQAKEMQELISRHNKEMDDAVANLQDVLQGGELLAPVISERRLENGGGEIKCSTSQSASSDSIVAAVPMEERLPAVVIEEAPLISPVQKLCDAGANSSFLVTASSQDGEIEPKDMDTAPLSGGVLNPVSVVNFSHVSTTVVADFPGNSAEDTKNQINKVRITPSQQTWRKHEFSFLETPRSGKWLVTNVSDDDISFGNTPTLGLNSMLKGMTINGQPQELMETPATRRLVTKRILKGVESLFY